MKKKKTAKKTTKRVTRKKAPTKKKTKAASKATAAKKKKTTGKKKVSKKSSVKTKKETKVLVIAGSDPSGGAGMQADLSTLKDFKIPAIFAMTAITAVNDQQILEIHPTPADLLTQQLSSACKNQQVGSVKIGMIATSANVRALVWFLQWMKPSHLVIDPVLHSSSGNSLLESKALRVFRQQLLPMATVVCPNLSEASTLAGMQVSNLELMQQAAQSIHQELMTFRKSSDLLKPLVVVIKGGHLPHDEAVDIYYDGTAFHEFRAARIPGKSPRGTGCRYSSAIAAELARGASTKEAVSAAKQYMSQYIFKAINSTRQ